MTYIDLDLWTWPTLGQSEPPCDECLGQRTFRLKLVVRTHTQTHAHSAPIALWGPLKWSVKRTNKGSAVAKMGDLARAKCAKKWGGAVFPSNNVAGAEARPISVPSGILIHPTVWPQYTNVTDRTGQDRHRLTMVRQHIGRTVLQTVARNWL